MFAGGSSVLTPRQQQIWDFVVDYVDTHGYPPTVREIGDAVGLASPSTVHAHLANLERAGLLRRDPRSRVPSARRTRTARLCAALARGGHAAAGRPDRRRRAVARRRQRRGVHERAGRGRSRRLRPPRQGRVDGGRRHPRRRLRRRAPPAGRPGDGEIVVALAGDDESADEATVKRIFRESGRVRLQPENATMDPIYADHVQLLGKVVGVFRKV